MKRRKPIRKVSLKRAKQLREYLPKRNTFIAAHPVCQMCHNARATDVHHGWGRIGELLNDEEHWFALCRTCHDFIHRNPSTARRQGFLL